MSISTGCANGPNDCHSSTPTPPVAAAHGINRVVSSLASSSSSSSSATHAAPLHHDCRSNGSATPLLSTASETSPCETECHVPYVTEHHLSVGYPGSCFRVEDRRAAVSGELTVNTDPQHLSGLTVFPGVSFHIKQESGVHHPHTPVRSLSIHSLPGNLVAPSGHSLPSDTPSSERYSLAHKVEMSSDPVDSFSTTFDTEHPTLIRTYGTSSLPVNYVTTSPLDPTRTVLFPSQLSNAFPLTVFNNHQCPSPSPLSLTSQGPLGTHHYAVSSVSTNSGTLAPHTPSDTFDLHEPLPPASHFALKLPHLSPDKRANSNTNGMCTNFTACDLSSALPIAVAPPGLSPRSKSRRYSYPYEPGKLATGIVATGSSPYHMISVVDHTGHSRQAISPNAFRAMTNSVPPLIHESTESVTHSNGSNRTVHTPVDEQPIALRNSLTTDHKCVPPPQPDGDIPLPGFNSPESAFYQYQHRMEGQRCQVCGELAAGFHHGAYVCEACKKFFMRHSLTDTKPTNVCPTGGNCVVAKGSRGKCQICRYRKCLYVGMKMKDPETQPDIDISNIPCRVCGGRSSGFHFGALTCEGCKGFFRRTEGSASSLVCVGGQNACTITPRSRNACKSCRFRRCLAAGMSKKGSRIGRQPNAVKFHCAIEIRQLRSLRANYPASTDVQSPPITSGHHHQHHHAYYGGVDISHMLDTPASTSLHNRDSPDATYHTTSNTKRDDSTVWLNDQKPPLSLLLLLPPRTSDPIDVTASLPDSASQRRLSHQTYASPVLAPSFARGSGGSGHTDSVFAVAMKCAPDANAALSLDDGEHLLAARSTSVAEDEDNVDDGGGGGDDDEIEVSILDHQRVPHPLVSSCRTTPSADSGGGGIYRGTTSSTVSSSPFGLRPGSGADTGAVSVAMDSPSRVLCVTGTHHQPSALFAHPNENGGNPTTTLTTALIASLAKRLNDEEQEDLETGLIADTSEDWTNTTPPPQEAIVRFIDGMRTATEFLRLPNTYFKTRFRMTSIPMNTRDNGVQVWNHMMNHFHMHAQQIVQFAKLVPGFNQLGITARSSLVRGAMYPVILLLLSRDYQPDTDAYNYFDFTDEERDTIIYHFPSFSRFTEHLRMAGRLLHHLNLSLPELSLSSAVEILRHYQTLEEPTRSSTRELFILANHSLRFCMTRHSDPTIDVPLDQRHRWAQLVALSKMIQAMNREHHGILAALKDSRFDLHFPELYVEMFQLADTASALFSASAQAVTLACSSAFQSLAPLKLSLCHPTLETGTLQSSPLQHNATSGITSTDSTSVVSDLTTQCAGFLATGDRWDAGRFALAVPAAMAAVAAAAVAEAHQPGTCSTSSSSVISQSLSPPPGPPPSFFFSRHPPS